MQTFKHNGEKKYLTDSSYFLIISTKLLYNIDIITSFYTSLYKLCMKKKDIFAEWRTPFFKFNNLLWQWLLSIDFDLFVGYRLRLWFGLSLLRLLLLAPPIARLPLQQRPLVFTALSPLPGYVAVLGGWCFLVTLNDRDGGSDLTGFGIPGEVGWDSAAGPVVVVQGSVVVLVVPRRVSLVVGRGWDAFEW